MKYALVTGASSGMGLEYARQLAALGHGIVVVSNRREENVQVARSLTEEFGIRALPLYTDLSDSGAAQEIYDWCVGQEVEVEVLVSNAGILHFGKLVKTSTAAIDRIMAIHCSTPVKLCRLFGADMARRGRGHILLMSSLTAWTPYPTMSLYGSTKVLLKGFGQSLWYELRESGVGVTTVFPSAVDTPFYELDPKMRKRLRFWGLMISPEGLVRKALRAMFAGKRRCIPGFWTKVEIGLCKIAPVWLFLLFMKLPVIKRIWNNC